MQVQNRKEHVELIVTVNQRGEPVYVDGAPALLGASLRRLQNVLKGQVLHCDEDAYNVCKAFHAAPHVLDMNGSHIDDISKMYREDNFDYQGGLTNTEIGHFMADYAGSIVSLYGLGSMLIQRGFVSRIHIAQYHDVTPPPAYEAANGRRIAFTPEALEANGYVLESSEWETLNVRAGGPTLAKHRHRVWRHKSVGKAVPLFLMDNTAWPVAPASRDISLRGVERVVEPPIADPTISFVGARDVVDPITGYRRPVWG